MFTLITAAVFLSGVPYSWQDYLIFDQRTLFVTGAHFWSHFKKVRVFSFYTQLTNSSKHTKGCNMNAGIQTRQNDCPLSPFCTPFFFFFCICVWWATNGQTVILHEKEAKNVKEVIFCLICLTLAQIRCQRCLCFDLHFFFEVCSHFCLVYNTL